MNLRGFGKLEAMVAPLGFGAWALGGQWGAQDDAHSQEALFRALDSGVNLIDTAEGYGDGRSERVIREALRTRTQPVFVATKTAPTPGPWPPSPWCRSEERYAERYLRDNVDQRLKNLGVERLDLLQLHTWTRAWNTNPAPFRILQDLRQAGKLRWIGVSTPEHDQNAVIDLMRAGVVDVVQVIYNLFEQEPAAELLPVAQELGIGVLARVPFDEGVLTGKYLPDHSFPADDFRARYFAGDRLERSVHRARAAVQAAREAGLPESVTPAELALRFTLSHPAVSAVLAGIRTAAQAEANVRAANEPPLTDEVLRALRPCNWRRGIWYSGK